MAFASALAFNLLIGGVDGHGKNYSFLLDRGRVRLAPLYDLITAHGIWDEQHVRFRAKMAMKYGKEYRMRNIDGRNLTRTADLLSMDRNEFFEVVLKLGARVPEAMAVALGELPEIDVSDKIRALPEVTARSVSEMLQRLDASHGNVEIQRPTSVPDRVTTAGTWMPGYLERGGWVSGRYRTRPGNR